MDRGQVGVGQVRRREASRQTLERSADEVQLLDVLLPDLRDAGTDARLECDETLGLEDAERLADGHRRDAESRREVRRPQGLTRAQLAVEDELAKATRDRLSQRVAVFRLGQDRIEVGRVFASGHRLLHSHIWHGTGAGISRRCGRPRSSISRVLVILTSIE